MIIVIFLYITHPCLSPHKTLSLIGSWQSFYLGVWWSFCLENQDTLEQTLWPVTAVVGGYKIIRHNSNGHADLFSFKLFLKQNCLPVI